MWWRSPTLHYLKTSVHTYLSINLYLLKYTQQNTTSIDINQPIHQPLREALAKQSALKQLAYWTIVYGVLVKWTQF